MNIRLERLRGRGRAAAVTLALSTLLMAGNASACLAQQSGPKTFSSAQEASRALFQAVQNRNEPALLQILGAGKTLVSSEDANQDKLDRMRFIEKYQEMHRLVREPDGATVLYIGAENWPFPVPLVSRNGIWRFDAKAGMQEVLCRRIGEDEEEAIQTCHLLALEDKQHKTPLANGPLLSHGYYFRSLTSPGNKAPGVAKSAHSNGGTTGGFVFVAYPAEYHTSGVMTFLVKRDGVVYEKDLGPSTTKQAKAMVGYRPVSAWTVAENGR